MTAISVPIHEDATATEKAAAKRAAKWAETLEAKVLAAVVHAGDEGLTAKEAREQLGLPVEKHYSVAPRLSAMRKHKGLVELTGQSRDDHQAYRATPAGRALIVPPCPTCRGNGGWQQSDGLIVECPRGCMTEERAA